MYQLGEDGQDEGVPRRDVGQDGEGGVADEAARDAVERVGVDGQLQVRGHLCSQPLV